MNGPEIRNAILRKLVSLGKWGGSHTSFDNLPKGFPKHLRGEVKEMAKELICQKYTTGLFDRWTKSTCKILGGIFLSMLKKSAGVSEANMSSVYDRWSPADLLTKENFILAKPTSYSLEVSLNPSMKKEIEGMTRQI